jgi:hypothetical protein
MNQTINSKEEPTMTTQVRETSTGLDLLYAGLGTVAGVAAVLTVQALWQNYVGGAEAAVTLTANTRLAQEAQVMGLPLVEGSKAYWYTARAGGLIAYLLLWLATLWGVMMSSKMAKGMIDATLLYGMHEFLPTLAMVFAALHAAVLMGDAYIGFSLVNLFVPFTTSYRPLWTGLGSVALYLSIALIASFYLKNLVGRKVWRAFHFVTYLAFGLALVHGIMAGTDTANPAVRWMYILTGAALLFATLYRILMVRGEAAARPAPAADRRTRSVRTDAAHAVQAEQVL